MHSLKEFYAQSTSTSEATNMYRVLTSMESVLLCITKVRCVGRGGRDREGGRRGREKERRGREKERRGRRRREGGRRGREGLLHVLHSLQSTSS